MKTAEDKARDERAADRDARDAADQLRRRKVAVYEVLVRSARRLHNLADDVHKSETSAEKATTELASIRADLAKPVDLLSLVLK